MSKNTHTPQEIKDLVKSHTVIPFSASQIACTERSLTIQDRYKAPDPDKLMETLGIRKNLSKDIFKKPGENWPIIQQALNGISNEKKFGAIVAANGDIITLVAAPKEATPLDYDKRIDAMMNTLDKAKRDLQNIIFLPEEADVRMNTIARDQVDCGQGDLWKYGTSVDIGYTSQQFNNYFLRLVCTNGMVTQENMAYRLLAKSDAIDVQYLNFTNDGAFARSITPRVEALRNNRASFFELASIAEALSEDQQKLMLPEYEIVKREYNNQGHVISKMSKFRQKFIYTNENLYDVFNRATNLASHRTEELGDLAVNTLNKAAADMFVKGPNLAFTVLDIYNN